MSEFELKGSRTRLKASLTRHQNAVERAVDQDVEFYNVRLNNIQEIFREYDKVQSQLEILQLNQCQDESEIAVAELSFNSERERVEDQYYTLLEKVNKMIKNGSGNRTQNISATATHQYAETTPLEPVPLPTFSGKHVEWLSFYNLFNSLVGDDPQLSTMRKFHYLRSCLKDEAFRSIESLAVAPENYESAIQILKKRFENKRVIVQEHVNVILNIPPMTKSNPAELRNLLNVLSNNIEALKVLRLPVEHWDGLLVPIILDKLDFASKREWQGIISKDIPKFTELLEFLEKRFEFLEATNNVASNAQQSSQNRVINNTKTRVMAQTMSKGTCALCKESHNISQCAQFLSLEPADRWRQAKQLALCLNCLRGGHTIATCRITFTCKQCHKKHHTVLHKSDPVQGANSLYVMASDQVLLSTVVIKIKDNTGNFQSCRAILDQGSEVNLITANLCKRLNLKPNKVNVNLTGVNLSNTAISERLGVTIKSRISEFTQHCDCLVLDKITRPSPNSTFNRNSIEIPPNITLADPQFNISRDIDLLIGAKLFWSLLISAPEQFKKNQPFFQKTKLGWILGGGFKVNQKAASRYSCCSVINDLREVDLDSQLTKFWEDEEVSNESISIFSQEEMECEQHFIDNTTRTRDGRFVVALPIKKEISLGNSRGLAFRQFQNLERKLNKDPILKGQYSKFMREYAELNHMEPVPYNQLEGPRSYYLPHHSVFKQTSEGPKIRVVFNASAKSSNGLSLNDHLMTGPTIQDDLFSILTRFRSHKIVVSADVTKMYRMILIKQPDADLQRILWRENPKDPIRTYRLRTVTYGTTCAPFLAVRVLKQLAIEAAEQYPLASQIIKSDFYMDDLLTGADSVESAVKLKNEIMQILKSGGLDLCKWISNCSEVVPISESSSSTLHFNDTRDIKILGFYWNQQGDQLKYKVNVTIHENTRKVTKRQILSTIAKIFDPLGLINPIIVKAKLLIQRLWSLKLKWDEVVPTEIGDEWLDYLDDLRNLNSFAINRSLMSRCPDNQVEIHGFADASTKAYGAVIYLKIDGCVNLICAKSRVAPLKTVTLPRLELNAAVLLARLMKKVVQALHMSLDNKYFWTDSTIVLSWLRGAPNTWKPYVASRVAKIQMQTETSQWRHVRSNDNPADIVSRGAKAHQLKKSSLWWHGPQWLGQPPATWHVPKTENSKNQEAVDVERKPTITVTNLTSVEEELTVIHKFSSFSKLKRVIAYCLRFCSNARDKSKNINALSVEELGRAEIVLLKYVQSKTFAEEIKQISKNSHTPKLAKLDPFVDKDGLLRVGGRLRHAKIPYGAKHPIILPAKHHLTKIIIREFHEREIHSGNENTLAAVRQQFWPLSARNTVRKVIHNCVKCVRANPRSFQQKMGNLPNARLRPSRPFYVSGVDYAGPFLIKTAKLKNAKKTKAYLAVFVCFATKAVHLELVGDLTTESFLGCFKRFTSRRGNVGEIYSDNGTNFVGAERELLRAEKFQNNVINGLAAKGTQFHFIPAKSPHFGGLWERAVRSVKHHLFRIIGDASLTYEEFYTVLTAIEACLNSRPLTPLSPDPNDYEPLTPGHFLIGAPITAPAENDLRLLKVNRLSRWQRVQQLQQHFWARWSKEYLSRMQQRPKGRTDAHEIKIGDLVALLDENLPPLKWSLGRVTKTHPGSDGIVRVVTVKTPEGSYKRAVNKVAVIPTDLGE